MTRHWLDPDTRRPCQGRDYLFFPAAGVHGMSKAAEQDVADAKALCEFCPVRIPCLDHAMTYEEAGIWGGTTQAERRQLRGKRGVLFHNPFRVVDPDLEEESA